MDKTIEQIEGLIAENKAIEKRTPFLDVALGGLITARDNCKEHQIALNKIDGVQAGPTNN
jgi:hypothetical protein